ncbi:MAG: hypothetical protein ACTH3J_03415, partial [Leuconostoc mesenteroides]
MKTSLTWINEYLDNVIDLHPKSVSDLAEKVERTSVEIDSNTKIASGQNGLVVAKILSVIPHPD